MNKKRGLIAQFTRLLLSAGLGCVLLFLVVYVAITAGLRTYFEHSDFRRRETERQMREFQSYVSDNGVASTDAEAITLWADGQRNVVLLELYQDGKLIYSSVAPDQSAVGQDNRRSPFYDWMPRMQIRFADGEAEAVLFCDTASVYYMIGTFILLVLCVALFLLLFLLGCRRIVRYICLLSEEVQAMEGGDLSRPITICGADELTSLASCLDSMRLSLRQQQEAEAQSAAKVKNLITEMSHDLRTPLTTLLLYTEIARGSKDGSPAQLENYLDKIDAKARQIKQMSDNLFEYALVTKDTVVALDPPAPLSQVFEEPLAEMVDQLQQRGFVCALELGSEDLMLTVCEQYVRRILDNITSNILKYADPKHNVTVTFVREAQRAGLAFGNMSLPQLDLTESTKVGLLSIETMMEKMHAESRVEQTGRWYCITLLFPVGGPQDR